MQFWQFGTGEASDVHVAEHWLLHFSLHTHSSSASSSWSVPGHRLPCCPCIASPHETQPGLVHALPHLLNAMSTQASSQLWVQQKSSSEHTVVAHALQSLSSGPP